MACTVLVVEDSRGSREAYLEILRDMGYRAVGAASASGALASVGDGSTRPDLVLTDLRLPDLDGRELMAQLRCQAARPLPALYITGWQFDEAPAPLSPWERLLQKPVEIDVLEATVRELLVLSRPGVSGGEGWQGAIAGQPQSAQSELPETASQRVASFESVNAGSDWPDASRQTGGR